MRRHLSDAALADAIAGGTAARVEKDPVDCEACQADLQRLRAAIAALASDLDTAAARPDGFWDRQRVSILSRIGQMPGRVEKASWWASLPVATTVAALLLGAVWWGSPTGRSGNVETDPALLLAVQHALDADAPSALRPAALLVVELEGTSPASPRGEEDQP